jgi:hypothetical protein
MPRQKHLSSKSQKIIRKLIELRAGRKKKGRTEVLPFNQLNQNT